MLCFLPPAGDGWASGGTGFDAWSITAESGNTGVAIASPSVGNMGTNGIGGSAFGLFVTANTSSQVNADRNLGTPLGTGDSLSVYWA